MPKLDNRRAADAAAIQAGVRHMTGARLVAFDAFVALLAEDIGADKAERAARFYSAHRLIKWDGTRYVVKHGAYLERDVLLRAAAA